MVANFSSFLEVDEQTSPRDLHQSLFGTEISTSAGTTSGVRDERMTRSELAGNLREGKDHVRWYWRMKRARRQWVQETGF